MVSNGLIAPFLGALQACISVLLTLCYGVAARKMRMVQEVSIKDMSALGVKLFFPALLIVNLGSHIHSGSVLNYVPVLGKSKNPKQTEHLSTQYTYVATANGH